MRGSGTCWPGCSATSRWMRTCRALSGGQRRQVALATVLVGDWDVLLLDEPTNHLDVEGIAWLAQHLKSRWPANAGALVVVTHDRWFLDEVCNTTWEVHDGHRRALRGRVRGATSCSGSSATGWRPPARPAAET